MTHPIPDEALNSHIGILGKTGSGEVKMPKERALDEVRSCPVCATKFRPRVKYPKQRFCSRGCGLKATLPADHNARVARETIASRSEALRGRGEGKGYRKLMGRHEHRRVAEEALGRPLRKGEVVHHKDGDRLNNDPSNLQVMSQREHMLEHGLGVPGERPAHEPWRARWEK